MKQFIRSPPLNKKRHKFIVLVFVQAEAVRFELTVPCGTPVFKTGALNHYATPPTIKFFNNNLFNLETPSHQIRYDDSVR